METVLSETDSSDKENNERKEADNGSSFASFNNSPIIE